MRQLDLPAAPWLLQGVSPDCDGSVGADRRVRGDLSTVRHDRVLGDERISTDRRLASDVLPLTDMGAGTDNGPSTDLRSLLQQGAVADLGVPPDMCAALHPSIGTDPRTG